jgi:tripartite-type tricarboxylate transporter receptor subunit TctC
MVHRIKMPRPIMRTLLLAGVTFATPAASQAQSWPGTKPFKFEVGVVPGGIIDLVPRELSTYLAASLGVPVVIENRPGAGGNIAAGFVAKAEPDGHTLLATSSNQAVNQTLLPNPGFDYQHDLVPVSMVAIAKLLLVASPTFPAETITDVIKIAKRSPKSVSIAISSIGTPGHLAAEMLAQYGGIDLTFVPYNGLPQALPDVTANRVNLVSGNISTLLPLVRSGALKALAVTSPQRSPLAPDIPTSAEAGLRALQIDAWICIMSSGSTPPSIVARLDEEIAKVLERPEVRDAFARQAIEIFHLNPQQLGTFLQSETVRFGELLKQARAKAAPQ